MGDDFTGNLNDDFGDDFDGCFGGDFGSGFGGDFAFVFAADWIGDFNYVLEDDRDSNLGDGLITAFRHDSALIFNLEDNVYLITFYWRDVVGVLVLLDGADGFGGGGTFDFFDLDSGIGAAAVNVLGISDEVGGG